MEKTQKLIDFTLLEYISGYSQATFAEIKLIVSKISFLEASLLYKSKNGEPTDYYLISQDKIYEIVDRIIRTIRILENEELVEFEPVGLSLKVSTSKFNALKKDLFSFHEVISTILDNYFCSILSEYPSDIEKINNTQKICSLSLSNCKVFLDIIRHSLLKEKI